MKFIYTQNLHILSNNFIKLHQNFAMNFSTQDPHIT